MAEKVRVQLLLDKDLVEAVDAIMAEVDGNRTAFISVCIENGLQDFKFLKRIFLTPRRLKKIGQKLVALGFLDPGEGGWASPPKPEDV